MANNYENDKLEWMYKGKELINRDEYLLGRKVDKSFQALQEEEAQQKLDIIGIKKPINHVEHDVVPFSIREYRNVVSTEQVDLQRKAMEDPLMLIKQREIEARRKLLDNPVKLNELQRMLRETTKQESSASDRKKRKNENKRRRRSSSQPSESEENVNKRLRRHLKRIKRASESAGKDAKIEYLLLQYLTASAKFTSKSLKKKRSKRNERRRDSNSSDAPSTDRDQRKKPPSRAREADDRRARLDNQLSSHRNAQRRGISDRKPVHDVKKHRLTDEEKAERLKQMMEEGERRNIERASNFQKHKEAREREDAELHSKSFDKEFINKEVRKAMARHNTIVSRIRSNINNVQRSALEMNKNFTKK